MNRIEADIHQALVDLDRSIAIMAFADPKPDLLPLFSRIDELAKQLPAETDPLLFHYLEKKSYEKARLFLEGRNAENAAGNCRGHVDAHGQPWKPRRQ